LYTRMDNDLQALKNSPATVRAFFCAPSVAYTMA